MGVNWKGLLGGIAPVIAKALTGGAPAAAAAALGVVGKALLGHEAASADEVAAAIAGATPEQLEKLRAAENEFALKLVDMAVQIEKIEADDRSSARAMQIAAHSHTPDVISFLVIAMFAGEMVFAHFFPVPPESRDAVSQIAGVLNISMGTVLGFWLGGSLGSRTTTAALLKRAAR
jgi:hypothetical protein